MNGDDLADRVAVLEQKMGQLERLPDRMESVEGRLGSVEGRLGSVEGRLTSVESQILQLRGDMNNGFSASRAEIQNDFRNLAEMINERFVRQAAEMRRLNDHTNAQMRMLYEDLKDSIKRIGEGPPSA